MRNYFFAVILCAALCECQRATSYDQEVADAPMPTSSEEQLADCNEVRGEIAPQENIAETLAYTSPGSLVALAAQTTARDHVAALNGRAAAMACGSAFSPQPAPTYDASGPMPLVQNAGGWQSTCMADCMSSGNISRNQCSASCSH